MSQGFTNPSITNIGYVPRNLDPGVHDWTGAAITSDATWRDLDCSSIVPFGAVAIHIKCVVSTTSASDWMQVRKKGFTGGIVNSQVATQVANAWTVVEWVVQCDSSRFIQYNFANVTYTSKNLTVLGWYI
jgi:hypothetical protein